MIPKSDFKGNSLLKTHKNLHFSTKNHGIYKIICIFVAAFPTRAVPDPQGKEGRSWGERGALHIEEVFAKATFLELLNVGNSITQNKSIAEVDTAGRYMILPRVRAEAHAASSTLYGRNIYTNGAGVKICLFFVRYPTT